MTKHDAAGKKETPTPPTPSTTGLSSFLNKLKLRPHIYLRYIISSNKHHITWSQNASHAKRNAAHKLCCQNQSFDLVLICGSKPSPYVGQNTSRESVTEHLNTTVDILLNLD